MKWYGKTISWISFSALTLQDIHIQPGQDDAGVHYQE